VQQPEMFDESKPLQFNFLVRDSVWGGGGLGVPPAIGGKGVWSLEYGIDPPARGNFFEIL